MASNEALREWLQPPRSALLVIDMQKDWLHDEGGMAQSGGDIRSMQAVIPTVQAVIRSARRAGVPVIFVRAWQSQWTMSKAQRARKGWSAVKGSGTRGFANTFGGEWCGVSPEPSDLVLDKCRYDAFLGTNLELVLDGLAVETVVCVGVATEVCVETTARSAFMRNFNVVVVSDATGTTDDASRDASLAALRKYFGRVEPSAVVARAWGDTSLDSAEQPERLRVPR